MLRRRLMKKTSEDWNVIMCDSIDAQTQISLQTPLGIDTVSGHTYHVTWEYEWTFLEEGTTQKEVRFPFYYDIAKTYFVGLNKRNFGTHTLDWTFTANKNMPASTNWQASARWIRGILKLKNYAIEEVEA